MQKIIAIFKEISLSNKAKNECTNVRKKANVGFSAPKAVQTESKDGQDYVQTTFRLHYNKCMPTKQW